MAEMLEQILEKCAPYTKQGKLADNPNIELDQAVYLSEKRIGIKIERLPIY